MKAVVFHEYGDPDVLRYEDVETPVPGAGQVRVQVAATTFNGVDANIRAALMQGPMRSSATAPRPSSCSRRPRPWLRRRRASRSPTPPRYLWSV